MKMHSKLIVALLLVFGAFVYSSCGDSGKSTDDTTENTPPPPPDPNTVFENFENLFSTKELPFAIPFDFQPYGGAIADEVKANFLPRKGNIYPGWHFKLADGYRGFISFDAESIESTFYFSLNVFDPQNKFVETRLVAGIDGAQVVDADFKEDGSWTETRRDIAEDTGMPAEEGIESTYSIDGNGKIVQQ